MLNIKRTAVMTLIQEALQKQAEMQLIRSPVTIINSSIYCTCYLKYLTDLQIYIFAVYFL